jgi:hypothetical protein
VNYATFTEPIGKWIAVRYAKLPAISNSSGDKTANVAKLIVESFPSDAVTADTAWTYRVFVAADQDEDEQDAFANPVVTYAVDEIRSDKRRYLHRGDSLLRHGHVMTTYSDIGGRAQGTQVSADDFFVIHASGSQSFFDSNGLKKFARKVTVTDVSRNTSLNFPIAAREILW